MSELRLLSIEDICRIFGVDRRTVHRWRTNERLAFPTGVRITREWRYVEGEIRAWIESRRQA